MAQQHFSFPTLPQQEILDVFAELQIPLTPEVQCHRLTLSLGTPNWGSLTILITYQALKKAPSGFMRVLYERVLFMLTVRCEIIILENATRGLSFIRVAGHPAGGAHDPQLCGNPGAR